MLIEYDQIYKKYVVWVKIQNIFCEIFKSKTKKECKKFIEKEKRKRK